MVKTRTPENERFMTANRNKKMKRLFDLALRHPKETRLDFVRKRSEDPGFCEELTKMLDSYDSEFMELPAVGELAEIVLKTHFTALMPGELFGHYEIIRQICVGGMGEVYLARDNRLGRDVAIKLLPIESLADPIANIRLLHEAQAAAQLNHKGICAIHELNSIGGRTFLVMQYIEGTTLKQILKNGPIDLRLAILYAENIAEALAYAHSHNVIHRDIKPENILIDDKFETKILDFGIAKIVPANSTLNEQEKVTSLLRAETFGTIGYMSPEQLRRTGTDSRTDIWSLGVVLYEMIAGERPFKSATTNDEIAAILTSEPRPIEEASNEISPEISRLIIKALRKNKEHRYQYMNDLLSDLRTIRKTLSVPKTHPIKPSSARYHTRFGN